jgi:hypothetical protein
MGHFVVDAALTLVLVFSVWLLAFFWSWMLDAWRRAVHLYRRIIAFCVCFDLSVGIGACICVLTNYIGWMWHSVDSKIDLHTPMVHLSFFLKDCSICESEPFLQVTPVTSCNCCGVKTFCPGILRYLQCRYGTWFGQGDVSFTTLSTVFVYDKQATLFPARSLNPSLIPIVEERGYPDRLAAIGNRQLECYIGVYVTDIHRILAFCEWHVRFLRFSILAWCRNWVMLDN